MNDIEHLKEQFIEKLEEKYGKWNRATSRFGNSSFGEISHALSISPSQFTKLISGTATEGMYSRSFENINRLIRRDSISKQLSELQKDHALIKAREAKRKKVLVYIIPVTILLSLFAGINLSSLLDFGTKTQNRSSDLSDHPLSGFFDNTDLEEFNSPYLDFSEIQDYCPCSAFEGEWSLADNYKLPLPGSKNPGLYYTAKIADVRMKCSRNDSIDAGMGRVLLGYEYLVNEIWIDTELRPLSEKYFDKSRKVFTKEFEELKFEDQEKFERVAVINSFFIDRFEIYDTHIIRKGEPCGRYASEVDHELADQFDIDIEYILKSVLSNLTTTSCEAAVNKFCDPNDLDVGDIISFDCIYTIETENLGIGGGYPYKKAYKLEKQNYTDNLTCGCNLPVQYQ